MNIKKWAVGVLAAVVAFTSIPVVPVMAADFTEVGTLDAFNTAITNGTAAIKLTEDITNTATADKVEEGEKQTATTGYWRVSPIEIQL